MQINEQIIPKQRAEKPSRRLKTMPKSAEVAAELRRIADALDKSSEAEMNRPMLAFWPDKEQFLTLARILPRPLHKRIDGEDSKYQKYVLESSKENPVWTHVSITRSEICIMVEPARPARYECPSILSAEEEEALGAF
jgi:hypothetical protein